MASLNTTYTCFLILACLSACSSDPGTVTETPNAGESGKLSDEPRPPDDAKRSPPLAVVELSPTHRVEFLEPVPGALLVSETGSISADPNSRVKSFDSAATLYAELAGNGVDGSVLETLRAADQRALARRSTVVTPPPTEALDQAPSTELVDKHSDFLWGNQCTTNSFEGNYCTWPRFDRVTSSDSGWTHCTERFRSTVFNHSITSTTGSAVHTVFYWGTEGDFWDQVAEAWVQRGTWHSWFSTWYYVKATTKRTSGQVSPGNHDQCILRDFYTGFWPWEPCAGSVVVLCRAD